MSNTQGNNSGPFDDLTAAWAESLGAQAPSLEELQGWSHQVSRAQQLLMEFAMDPENQAKMGEQWQQWMDPAKWQASFSSPPAALGMTSASPEDMLAMGTGFWQQSLSAWQQLLSGNAPLAAAPSKDRRFADEQWRTHPLFAFILQSYQQIADRLLQVPDMVEGVDEETRTRLKFMAQGTADALSPSNFALTNPAVVRRTIETHGENLVKGLEHMLTDIKRGQMTHVDRSAFEVGRNIATTPGQVVHESPLYQLIHYAPTTETVLRAPLLIFPPWINRFYILDLNAEKSFVRWCVEQGLSTFIVSWKSADESTKDVVWDDYVAAQIEAIDVVRKRLDVKRVHTIGYCVAGTTLAATLSVLAARGDAKKVASATFFTAQVDFEKAGDLKLMTDEAHLALIEQLSAPGWLDGRYMAATFNSLRGRDLIWNYVVNNYLLGQDYPPFDLLYWNGDTTNLPAKWHHAYLRDLYRDNRLVEPGALSVLGTPIDLTRIETPAFIQAGREDHIAPPDSVWRIMQHLQGPKHFVLAGSGHIAGVVNPPAANKYQYWTGDDAAADLDAFVAGAKETPGSWWPHWIEWLRGVSDKESKVEGARIPENGTPPPIEPAPGRYVKQH